MSEAAPESETTDALPSVFSPFSALMDVMVPEPGTETNDEGEAAAGADAAAAGSAAPGGEGESPAAGAPAAPAAGDAGKPAVPVAGDASLTAGSPAAPVAGDGQPAADAGAAPVAGVPAEWTADPAALTAQLGTISTALETRTEEGFRGTALNEVQTEYKNYFDAVQKHPRLLVGTEVPAIGKEGNETIRDSEDAREWQEAVKSLLVAEVNDRVSRSMEQSGDYLATLHQSIELFQNNADLLPGTKGFDVELANKFTELAQPYEVRVDGKLHGYTIPVQPIINQLRTQLTTSRAAAPAATSPAAGAPAAATKPAEPPQAGIPSKAGNSSEKEDFSTLFGTIGLPNLVV